MKDNNEIAGFFSWKIPSGEGVVYLEGIPTEEERKENRQQTAERRKIWQPDEYALSVYKRLKLLEGKQIIIQLWHDVMEMRPDDGTNPFSCELLKVFTENINGDDRFFQ